MRTRKNQALTLKTKFEPQSQEPHTQKKSNRYQNQAHNDSNACRESLRKGSETILKCDILNYLCFTMLLGPLYITCKLWWAASLSHPVGQFMFCDGCPPVLASWVDYLLTTPFHILPLLSFLGFKKTSCILCWEQMTQPLFWAEGTYSTPLGKPSCCPIKVSSKFPSNEPIIPPRQVAFHWHDRTADLHQTRVHTRLTDIQMHEQRDLLWLSAPSLTQPGPGTDWIPGSCTGGR